MKPEIATYKWNRFFIIIVNLTLIALSCISPFEPNYKGEDNLLVVDGSLIKGVETQVIKISRSSSIVHPKYQPEKNCQVRIMDDSGNEFFFIEEIPGKYVASINDALLNYGAQYKLIFSIPGGGNYESGYQELLKTAPVENFYSFNENHYDPLMNQENIEGLQFYVDLEAPDDASRYYKWQINETWQIHSQFKIIGFYDGKTIRISDIPSDSLYYCWSSKTSEGIYTSSTINLSHNTIEKVPLHFKLKSSQDLTIKYCATVRQFALNEDAYDYWHQKGIELNESGQIYTTQPNQFKSNIYNTGNPEEKVLGFFWASSCTEKHLFFENPFGVEFIYLEEVCKALTSCEMASGEVLLNALYAYIARNRNFPRSPLYIYFTPPFCYNFCTTPPCIDCRLLGGATKKPDFWGNTVLSK